MTKEKLLEIQIDGFLSEVKKVNKSFTLKRSSLLGLFNKLNDQLKAKKAIPFQNYDGLGIDMKDKRVNKYRECINQLMSYWGKMEWEPKALGDETYQELTFVIDEASKKDWETARQIVSNPRLKGSFDANGFPLFPPKFCKVDEVLDNIYPTVKWPVNTAGLTTFRKLIIKAAVDQNIHPVLLNVAIFLKGDASEWIKNSMFTSSLSDPVSYSSCHPTAIPLFELFSDSDQGVTKIGNAGQNGAGSGAGTNDDVAKRIIEKIKKPDAPGNVIWLTYGDHSITLLIYKEGEVVKMESLETWAGANRYRMVPLYNSIINNKVIDTKKAQDALGAICEGSQTDRKKAFRELSISGWVADKIAADIGVLKTNKKVEETLADWIKGIKKSAETWDGLF